MLRSACTGDLCSVHSIISSSPDDAGRTELLHMRNHRGSFTYYQVVLEKEVGEVEGAEIFHMHGMCLRRNFPSTVKQVSRALFAHHHLPVTSRAVLNHGEVMCDHAQPPYSSEVLPDMTSGCIQKVFQHGFAIHIESSMATHG